MWTRNSLAAALLVLALPAAAQLGGSSSAQDHSAASKGGTTIAPKLINMTATSTATFAGRVNLTGVTSSSGAVTMQPASTFTARGRVEIALGANANLEVFVASGTAVDVTTMTVDLSPYVTDAASETWRVRYNCRYSSANYISVVFNQDKSADVYSEHVFRVTLGGASASHSATSAECGQLVHLQVGANTYLRGYIDFESVYGGPANQFFYEGAVVAEDASEVGSNYRNQYGGKYENPNGTPVTKVSLTGHTGACTSTVTPAGMFRCRWQLSKVGRGWR
jgi:hypothetical protein